jgi:hypothetical protein
MNMPISTRTSLAVVLAALCALIAGCGTNSPPPLSARALRPTRQFRDLPIFWTGTSFEGIALTAADRPEDYLPALGMRVYYGDCGHHALLSSGGCTLPLEINSILYKSHSTLDLGPQRATRLRGVPAIIFDGGRSIELYTGRVSVDVYSDSPSRALRAVRALRTLNVPLVRRPGARLPPPEIPPGPAPH